MTDVDQLVQRAVNGITKIAGRAAAFATWILVVTAVVSIGGLLLGVAALSGGIETVWIVLGTVFASLAIGGAFLAAWRARSVKRHVSELMGEIRLLVIEGRDSTVIETFAVQADDAPERGSGGSAILMTRQMSGFRTVGGGGLERAPRLDAAVRALASFPLLVLMAILISTVFAFLGFIFLIALAL